MASFDYRLNPLYPIKECSSCGALYTTDYCCSEGSLGDKIICDLNQTPDLFQQPPQNCPKCGHPVDGHYCQECALLRKKFKEDQFTYCVKNGILQDSFEPSNDNTNVFNALREPFVVKQDPGKTSSQSPPQISHHCCYRCGDPLEDIFCHRCTCELCGRDGNSFTYDSTSNLVHDSPNIFSPPLGPHETCQCDQLIFDEPYCENYGGPHMSFQCQPMNQNHYEPNPCYDSNSFGFDQFQPPLFLVIHQPIHEKKCAKLLAEEHEANINTQPFQYSVVTQPPQEDMSVEFLQEKRNQMNSVKTFLGKFNRISFYKMPKVLSLAWETILKIELAFEDKHCQPEDILELFQRLHNDVQNIHEELAVYINTLNWDRPTICYSDDDDEDYAIAITPSLSTKEPDKYISMGDEHLDTVPTTESDEFIMSSVENLVIIPSESKGIPDNMCDMPFHDNSPPLDVSKDQFKDFFDSNNDSTSTDDDSFSIDNIEYVEASPPNYELLSSEVMEIVIPEVGGIEDDILLTIKDDILREKLLNVNLLIANIKALKDNRAPSSDFMTKSFSTSLNYLLEETNTFDNSLPKLETFCFDLEEISSGSTTTRSDIFLPEYEAFYDDHVKEISSGSTTTHSDSSLYYSFIFDLSINPFPPVDRIDFYEFADELAHIISPPEYDCLWFKFEPNSGDFTMDVVENIFPTREPRFHVHNALPTHLTLQLNLDFILSSESLFAYVVWIFLHFLSYSVAPQYLLSFGNKDTIFDPGISSYHISSFMPYVSHRSGTFIKFKVLNESPMEISFSTCSLMDQ
nr:hypothetical protein [Tanacetum cinerariifolium]